MNPAPPVTSAPLPSNAVPCSFRQSVIRAISTMLYSRAVHLMTSPVKTSVLPRAILFDMDGTLTTPVLDFPKIRAELGVGPGPILESLARLDQTRRDQAEAKLHCIEDGAAKNSVLNEGFRDLLAWLAANGLPTALITRNSRLSAQTVF